MSRHRVQQQSIGSVGSSLKRRSNRKCLCGESPVVKLATIQTILSIAISKSWCLHRLDVKNSFLHGNINEIVYTHQLPSFHDPYHPDYVCILNKSLYGLRAPHAWYQRFTKFVSTLDFSHSASDHSSFLYDNGNDTAYILLYVNAIILTTSSNTFRHRIMSQLSSKFEMKDLGHVNYFLVMSKTASARFYRSSKKRVSFQHGVV